MYQEIKGTVPGQEEPIRREHGQVLIVVVSPQGAVLNVQSRRKQMVFDHEIFIPLMVISFIIIEK